jgi:hypothetical protein
VQQAAHARDVRAHAGALVAQPERVPHLLHAGGPRERERADDDREERRREASSGMPVWNATVPASVCPRSLRLPTSADDRRAEHEHADEEGQQPSMRV